MGQQPSSPVMSEVHMKTKSKRWQSYGQWRLKEIQDSWVKCRVVLSQIGFDLIPSQHVISQSKFVG